MLAFSDYRCDGGVPLGGLLSFAFTGITGGAGVGGNAATPASSLLLPVGSYLIVFKTAGFSNAPGDLAVKATLDGAFATEFDLFGALQFAGGGKIINVFYPSQTLQFVTGGIGGQPISSTQFFDCNLSLIKLQ